MNTIYNTTSIIITIIITWCVCIGSYLLLTHGHDTVTSITLTKHGDRLKVSNQSGSVSVSPFVMLFMHGSMADGDKVLITQLGDCPADFKSVRPSTTRR